MARRHGIGFDGDLRAHSAAGVLGVGATGTKVRGEWGAAHVEPLRVVVDGVIAVHDGIVHDSDGFRIVGEL